MDTSPAELNRISDAQWSFPILRNVAPSKEEMLPARVTFWTAVFVAALIVTGKAAVSFFLHGELYTPEISSGFVAYWLVSYLCYSLTFGRAWNLRAQQTKSLRVGVGAQRAV